MFKANNGFTLQDAGTKWGWDIKTPEDLITALLGMPQFDTVYSEFICEALKQAMEERLEYANIDDLADYLATNYL